MSGHSLVHTLQKPLLKGPCKRGECFNLSEVITIYINILWYLMQNDNIKWAIDKGLKLIATPERKQLERIWNLILQCAVWIFVRSCLKLIINHDGVQRMAARTPHWKKMPWLNLMVPTTFYKRLMTNGLIKHR